jgi:hypothetical protein
MVENNILHSNVLLKFTDESKTKLIAKLSDYGFIKKLNNYNYSAFTHL